MRILVATDAWRPQVNGVVNTYERMAEEMPRLGITLGMIEPSSFRSIPCPTYPEIPLSLVTQAAIDKKIADFKPTYIHIATEGPIGLATRKWCIRARRIFTTSYHTRFPEYVAARLPVPIRWMYSFEKWFHNAGCGVLVVTQSLASQLTSLGFARIFPWTRGVNTDLFRPRNIRNFGLQPVFLYVGRIAVEKNIEAFLNLPLPGKKVVVGAGPQLASYRQLYPDINFCGQLSGLDLAEAYSSADVLVFPSLTDTFGNVMLEALACGTPVAAHPVTGPVDLITDPKVGVLSNDLLEAASAALHLTGDHCRSHALQYTWQRSAELFVSSIARANDNSAKSDTDISHQSTFGAC